MIITLKEVPSTTFLLARKIVYSSEISGFAETIIPELYSTAQNIGVTILGPVTLILIGVTDDPETPFALEVAFPVSQPLPYRGEYRFKTTQPFKCFVTDSKTQIHHVQSSLKKLAEHAISRGYRLSGELRQVHKNWNIPYSAGPGIELQVGIF